MEIENKLEQLALFNLAIDSKLRVCDLLSLKLWDISSASLVQSRAMIEQQKTHKEVQFEITPKTQQCLSQWISINELSSSEFLFPSPRKPGHHTPRQGFSLRLKFVSRKGGSYGVKFKKLYAISGGELNPLSLKIAI